MSRRVGWCLRVYRRLADAYPHEFRMRHGQDLDRLGADAIPQISRQYGWGGLLRLLGDLAVRLPGMYLVEMRQDLVYAVRTLAKSPGSSLAAALSLALGIGACCAVMSESAAIIGPPPHVRNPGELATFRWTTVSYPYFERFRAEPGVAAATALLGPLPFSVAVSPDPASRGERFFGHLVSPDYFLALGVTPAAGRFFSTETEKPGMPPVVVVSERFWRRRLASDPRAVGRVLRVNGRMATVVGIAPRGFLGIWQGTPADLFLPVTSEASLAPELAGDLLRRPDREIFRVVFRPTPGTTLRQLEAGFNAVARHLDAQYALDNEPERKNRLLRLMPAGTRMYATPEQVAFVNTFNVVLWGLVLALVCANVANLLLARGGQRRREIAIRLSIGASRPRLVRQFLTESIVLSLAGAVGGIALAFAITRVVAALPVPAPVPQEFPCEPNLTVLAITIAIAVVAGIGFGLSPALSSARVPVGAALKEGAQAPLRGYRPFGSRNVFVVCQMAASLMLLLVTGVVARGFLGISRLDVGYDTHTLVLISLDPARDGFTAEAGSALLSSLPDELATVSGVRSVSFAGEGLFASLAAAQPNTRVDAGDGQAQREVFRERVSARYFATVGVPLLSGREFDDRDGRTDGRDSAIPAIVNQSAARQLLGAGDPIGKPVREGGRNYRIVGVSADTSAGFLTTKAVPSLFLPFGAEALRRNQRVTFLLRVTSVRDAIAAARARLESLHPGLTVFDAHTMRDDLERLNAFVESQATIYIALAVLALLLASIGLGAVTAYAAARRRKEIGIRMALGARGRQVQWLLLREGSALIAMGMAVGLAGEYALARLFSAYSEPLSRTFGHQEHTYLLVVGAPVALSALAMLACYLPARRASGIDPMASLREE